MNSGLIDNGNQTCENARLAGAAHAAATVTRMGFAPTTPAVSDVTLAGATCAGANHDDTVPMFLLGALGILMGQIAVVLAML